MPTKNGDATYLDGEYHYWSCELEKVQNWLDDLLPFGFQHSEDLDKMERSIQAELNEVVDEDAEDDFYFCIEHFKEINPAEYEFA